MLILGDFQWGADFVSSVSLYVTLHSLLSQLDTTLTSSSVTTASIAQKPKPCDYNSGDGYT